MKLTAVPIQELLDHNDVSTAMIDTHVLHRGGRGVRSTLDAPTYLQFGWQAKPSCSP